MMSSAMSVLILLPFLVVPPHESGSRNNISSSMIARFEIFCQLIYNALPETQQVTHERGTRKAMQFGQ
jgi:hypothetical protein